MAQWHCSIQGQQYGPIDEATVRQWIAERRLTAGDHVWREGMADWLPLSSVPELGGTPAPGGVAPPPPLPGVYGAPTRYLKPHRGSTVLVFGILGWFICIIFGIAAWVMGKNDLAEMDAGTMDPAGRDQTNAGRIIGMIATILAIVGVGIGILVGIIAAVARVSSVHYH